MSRKSPADRAVWWATLTMILAAVPLVLFVLALLVIVLGAAIAVVRH